MERPVFCEICRFSRAKKNNPNVADKYCPKCTQKQFLCSECDHQTHRVGPLRLHMRQIIVLGHGVRKITKVRGDGVNFPLPMDKVEIILKSKIYHEGKEINREPPRRYQFMVGLSGRTMHVQVLGAKNLVSADLSGTSDPFVKASYSGKMLGTTRVRPRALNPKWDNETFLVPMDPRLPEPRKVSNSQKDVFRLEVYDYDWLGSNDMLGIVELSRSKLKKLASIAGSTPFVLPLTLSEFHGILGVELGICRRYVHIKVMRGEALDSADLFGASDPYAKVHFRSWYMGKTPTIQDTNDPEWKEGNVFYIKINDLLREERKLLLQKRQRELRDTSSLGGMLAAAVSTNRDDVAIDIEDGFKDTGDDSIFSIELFDDNKYARHVSLGVAKIDVDILRVMLPQLPTAYVTELLPAGGVQKAQAAKALSLAKPPVQLGKGMSSRLYSMTSMRGAALMVDDGSDSSLASDVDLTELYEGAGARFEEYDPVLSHLSKVVDDPTGDGETSDSHSRQNKFSRSSRSASPHQTPSQTPFNQSPTQSPFQTHLHTPAGSRLGSPSATPRLSLTSTNLQLLGNKSLQERVSTMYTEYLDESQLDKKIEHLQSTIRAIQERGDVITDASPDNEGRARARTISFEDDQELASPSGQAAPGSSPGASSNKDIEEIVQSLKAELAELMARRQVQAPRLMAITEEQSFIERTVSVPATKRLDDFSDSEVEDDQEAGGSLLEPQVKEKGPASSLGMLKQGRVMLSRGISSGALLKGLSSGALSRGISSGALLKGLSSGALLDRGEEEEDDVDPVAWSRVRHFNVVQMSQDNVARPEVKDRGFLVVRLLSATRGNVIAGLDEGVRAMTVGETALLKIRFDYAYGHYCMGSSIPPRANIIFDVKLVRLNGYGKLGMPLRQARRFLRLFIRAWKICKGAFYASRRYMQRHKPIKHCMRSIMRLFGGSVALGSDSASLAEDRSVEVYEELDDEESEEEEEDPVAAAQATQEVKIDPKMKRLVNPSVKAGSKYLFGWQPEKRIVRTAPVRQRRPQKGAKGGGTDGGYDDATSQEKGSVAEGSQLDGTEGRREEEEEEPYYDPYDPNAPHERRQAFAQQPQQQEAGIPDLEHRQAFFKPGHEEEE